MATVKPHYILDQGLYEVEPKTCDDAGYDGYTIEMEDILDRLSIEENKKDFEVIYLESEPKIKQAQKDRGESTAQP